ncbi:MAG: TIGR04076 family protein [Planctomycetes bacterium]|nr:TIGR04076 family protein [Planctomycetota bacterium]
MPGYKVTVTCKEVKGHCAAGQEVGDTATFEGINVQGRICIHSLASMMSKVFAMQQGVNFSWLEDPNLATHACPDAYNPVVYEIRREEIT